MRCDRCGKLRPLCLRFGTLAPGYSCGQSHYADILWIAPYFGVGAIILGLKAILTRYRGEGK